MTLTKILCRMFDDENKGYVTIWDVVGDLLAIGIAICIAVLIIYSIYEFIVAWITWDTSSNTILSGYVMLGGISSVLIGWIICIFIFQIIGNIKIAKCKR